MDKVYANKIHRVCIGMLLAVSLIVMGGCSVMKSEKEKVQESMAAYLKNKYSNEFEVNTPYMTGSMGTAHYQAKAHLKGQPEIEFKVNGDNYDYRMNGKYDDNYLTTKWSYQGRQEVEKKLKEVYGGDADFKVRRYEFVGNSTFKDLDYTQVFEKSHGTGLIYIAYDIFMDSAKFNKEEESRKAYQILKAFVLDFGSDVYSFDVTYINQAFKQDYLENFGQYLNTKAYQEKKLLGWLQVSFASSESKAINSSSDLNNFFKY